MPKDEELIFADHVGRFYAREHGFPPMAGRLFGYLMICDPQQQTIEELTDHELDQIRNRYEKLARQAREDLQRGLLDTGRPDVDR